MSAETKLELHRKYCKGGEEVNDETKALIHERLGDLAKGNVISTDEMKERLRKSRAAKIGVCNTFLAKIIGKGTIENKVRYLLEDFFFDEGWSARTNPKNGKDGYSCSHTYNDDKIRHFIEDFTRWIADDWEKSFKKACEESKEK